MEKIQALPSLKNLPTGVSQDVLGESKIMADIFMGFATSLGLGILLTYAVLVLLFSGFLQPLTIMGALPLAIGGALAGLLVGHKDLDMMALIGIMMLMGLVTKNSILLVEYAMKMRLAGQKRFESLLLAGKNRLRPILMTTIAMIAGMTPIALSLGEGTEALSPMAVAVIGGLITSTLLTLVVIPAAYTVIDDIQAFLRRLLKFGPPIEKELTLPRSPATPQIH
jgi:multidrug efflux pump subunit AcrB